MRSLTDEEVKARAALAESEARFESWNRFCGVAFPVILTALVAIPFVVVAVAFLWG